MAVSAINRSAVCVCELLRSNRIFDRYAGRLDLITIDLDRLTRLDSRRLHDRGSVGKLADPDETIANAVR